MGGEGYGVVWPPPARSPLAHERTRLFAVHTPYLSSQSAAGAQRASARRRASAPRHSFDQRGLLLQRQRHLVQPSTPRLQRRSPLLADPRRRCRLYGLPRMQCRWRRAAQGTPVTPTCLGPGCASRPATSSTCSSSRTVLRRSPESVGQMQLRQRSERRTTCFRCV